MKKAYVFLLTALLGAGLLSAAWSSEPYDDQLIRLQARQALGPIAAELAAEPVEIQALLLDYSLEPELLLQARLALLRQPDAAREVLLLYGAEPEFQQVLARHGPAVIPPIQYFLEHEIRSLQLRRLAARGVQAVAGGNGGATELSARERGWYAVSFIAAEGHGFLGQFVVDGQGNVQWLQTERVLEGLNALFAGGFRTLETKYRLDEQITAVDAFWAGTDVAVIGATFKLLRVSRAASSAGRPLSVATRTRGYGAGLLRGAQRGGRFALYAAIPAAGYVLVTNPKLLHSLFAEAAQLLGVNPRLVQFAGWSLVLLVGLYVLSWLLRLLVGPLIFLLRLTIGLLRSLQGVLAGRRRSIFAD